MVLELTSPINEQLALLQQRCPILCPTIFPTYFCPRSIDQLCSSSAQSSKLKKLLTSEQISFPTSIRLANGEVIIEEFKVTNEIDSTLYRLEEMMNLLSTKSDQELGVYVHRFLEINGHDLEISDGRKLFYEVYQLAYSLKVILSNMPGLTVKFKNYSLPLPQDTDLSEALKPIKKTKSASEEKSQKKSIQPVKVNAPEGTGKRDIATVKADSDNSDSDNEEELEKNSKKRRRKRGKA